MAMASEAFALFLGHVPRNCKVVPPISFSRRFIVVSCKMRHSNFSPKRNEQTNRAPPSQLHLRADLDPLSSETDNFVDNNNTIDGAVSTGEDEIKEIQKDEGTSEPPTLPLQHLIKMIKNAEENILLLNEARIKALEEVDKVLAEKEALHSEIKILETKLAEIDSKLKVTNQEKADTSTRTNTSSDSSLLSEINTLRIENSVLKSKVEELKEKEKRVEMLEREKCQLEASIKDLEESAQTEEDENKFNEELQKKVKTLEEQLRVSDKEINALMKLYEESVEVFQKTLDKLKEESEKSVRDLKEVSWEFWSSLSLMVDGWLLEKKISVADAEKLRNLVLNRDLYLRETYLSCKGLNESEIIAKFLKLTLPRNSSGLHVVHIAAEMAPIAKVGGLGDVVSGLCKALQRKGNMVEIILPKYDCMDHDRVQDLKVLHETVESYFEGQLFKNKIWVGIVEGLPVYFIEPLHPAKYFSRGKFYGDGDDFRRFMYFSRAALELLLESKKKPDIIHCHDWQTAFVAPLYWDIFANRGLNSARICFTCHNFEHQGAVPAHDLKPCGLDVDHLDRPDRLQDDSSHGRINAVKGAIVYSNIVTTVSPTYAQEVRSPEGGRGLHLALKTHSRKFFGVLNGIDTDTWNPRADNFIKAQYSYDDLQGKLINKDYIRKQLGLSTSDPSQPLVGCITRLVPQKGVHLIRNAMYKTLELGGQFVLLGSSPVPHIQKEFESIAENFKSHADARLILKYDDVFSHLIYAASDMFIIPSIFEPCGLTQMIAMQYGSIPIARKTGGLNDSVFDLDDNSIPAELRNGFTFVNADEQSLNGAMERAFKYYKKNPEVWQELVKRAMTIDFSWESSASQYEELYHKSLARARAFAQT
ncbi:putative starch synthase 4 [Carex littledalei]|uniref:Starch synthase, chloroplastic/amyloplastic n=1 Tax=Carex littledalei TaxID=544730 RepID=A0A833V885_9POAL|nr:putative starch synthase 4 [Carex littledalei]